jgi:hypothetical protein
MSKHPDRDPEGLSQACADPADLDLVVRNVVEDNPTAHQTVHMRAVMKHYGGKVSPNAVIHSIGRAMVDLEPLKSSARAHVDLAINGLIMTKQIAVLLSALQQIQREWSPSRKVSHCDPYTVATQALKKYDEYEELKPDAQT